MSPGMTEILRRGGALALAACLIAGTPRPASAIVGGSSAPGAMARSSVMILNSRGGVCTGVVLAPDVVLTAAHCASGASEHRIHYRGPDGAPVLVVPAEVKLHPGFSPGAEKTRRRSVDLALMRVPEPLPGFTAAKLSTGGAAKGTNVSVSGYGVAQEGDGRSSGTFRAADLTVVEPHGPSAILLWLSPSQNEAGACQGDSGGPITAAAGVVAITSWASGKGRRSCGALTQGILVAPQRGWIDKILWQWRRTAAWN